MAEGHDCRAERGEEEPKGKGNAAAKPFDRSLLREKGGFRYLQQEYERRASKRTGAQLWDLTTAPCEAIARSGKPLDWFKRDAAHNDDRGKQLIARTLAAYFRVVANSRAFASQTAELQARIDEVWRRGGGEVVLDAGTHELASVRLRSGITLRLKAGASKLTSSGRNGDSRH